MKHGNKASHVVHFGNKCRDVVIFSIPQLNFQENNPLEFLKILMFLAARQVAVYIPTAALAFGTTTCIQVVNLLHVPAFFGHLQGGIQQRKIK